MEKDLTNHIFKKFKYITPGIMKSSFQIIF